MLSPRGGGSGICGVLGHLIFLANFQSNAPPSGNKYWSNTPPFCNKYYINKSHLVQIALTQAQNANQNPQGGDAIDYEIPHICPTPPQGLELTLIGALL